MKKKVGVLLAESEKGSTFATAFGNEAFVGPCGPADIDILDKCNKRKGSGSIQTPLGELEGK